MNLIKGVRATWLKEVPAFNLMQVFARIMRASLILLTGQL